MLIGMALYRWGLFEGRMNRRKQRFWGWTAEDGTEIAIMGTGLGVAYIDVTNPLEPTVIGTTGQAGDAPLTDPFDLIIAYLNGVVWRDVKVAGDHAFIVSERGGGMQVVDLNEVIAAPGDATRNVEPVAVYTDRGAHTFHNIAINEATDTAFLVGVFGDTISDGGLHMVDIADPANPTFAGAFAADGYTHDAQCVIYEGPDDDYNGTDPDGPGPLEGYQAELCFAYNEDTVTVVDVTAPMDGRGMRGSIVTKIGYVPGNDGPGVPNDVLGPFYTHQGWLTPDHGFIVFNDELDEQNTQLNGLTGGTRTYHVEIADLDANDDDGSYIGDTVDVFLHDTLSTDHNLYIRDDLVFEANYNAGLRVLRYTVVPDDDGEGNDLALEEVGFFDVDPGLDAPHYGGAWNVYPFFESGTIVVSSLDEGLYTLRFNDPAAAQGESALASGVTGAAGVLGG